jgi:LysM repeat protein
VLNQVEPPPARPLSRTGSRGPLGHLWVWAVPVGLVLLALVLLVIGGSRTRIWPGVRVLGLDVGGKSRAQAVALLQRDWESRAILLYGDGVARAVDPSALGLVLDAEATTERARAEGRSAARLLRLLNGRGRIDVSPVVLVQRNTAATCLESLRLLVDAPPQSAGVRITEGQVEAIQAAVGRSLDVGMTLANLELQAAQVVGEGRLRLETVSVSPTISDPQPLVSQAQRWLAHTLRVQATDPIRSEESVWTVAASIWSGWVFWHVDAAGTGQLDPEFDAGQVRDHLAGLAVTLGSDRYLDLDAALKAVQAAVADGSWDVRLRVYHHGQQRTVQAGETIASIARDVGIPYPWILQANPGVSDTLRVGQVLSIPSPDVLLPLPVVENRRIVVSISSQAMWAYDNGALLWQWPVSTGIESSPTSPGVFQVLMHEPNAYAASWDLWMPYFIGIYRPVPTSQFMNGFHGFPTRDGATLLWTGNLGHPVTFGCILLSTQNAATLYEWVQEGTVVEIRP